MNIAFFDTKPYDLPAFQRYGKESGINFHFFDTKLTEETSVLAHGFDGACVFVNDTVSKEVINALLKEGCKFLVLRCAGYNQVDLKSAVGKIKVYHVPAYSPYGVAEHAMALLLTSVRRTHKAYIRTRDFNFSLNGLVGFDLHGKTVGIIGTGRIGTEFAKICHGFGMRILAYDKKSRATKLYENTDTDTIFGESDIISLHCPLNEETHHLINRKSIQKMKKGVIIINTSRGALMDADALLWGIKERIVGGACLDVYEEETDIFFEDRSGHILEDDTLARLISMPNVILSSHQGFLTQEALDAIAKTTVENILSFANGKESENELTQRIKH